MATRRRIMECVERPLAVVTAEGGTADVVIGASMGIVQAPETGGRPPTRPTRSCATPTPPCTGRRTSGRNRWTVFDASMRDAGPRAGRDRVGAAPAVAQDQLSVAYQPIVELDTGRPLGAEALVRWQHPVPRLDRARHVHPVAEDSGLISALGAWVLRESLRQLARWRADGVVDDDFWMSVNVSPRQLGDPAFAERLGGAAAAYGVPAATLVLEITESVMVDGSDADRTGPAASCARSACRSPSTTSAPVLRAGLPAPAPGHRGEDRPLVRRRPRRQRRGRGDRAGRRRDEQRAAPRGRRRGRGDPGAARRAGGARCTLGQGWLWGKAVDPRHVRRHLGGPRGTTRGRSVRLNR